MFLKKEKVFIENLAFNFYSVFILNSSYLTDQEKTLALIEMYKLEKEADESENSILWPKIHEYIKIYKRWNIVEDKLKLGELFNSVNCRLICILYQN